MSDSVATVLFFAGARDATGTKECVVSVRPEGVTVENLATSIVQKFPALEPYMRSLRIAVNGEYVNNSHLVKPGDEVAVIPPVAGGS